MKKRHSESQRLKLVAQWRASGESARLFAKRKGIALSTFYEWKRRAPAEPGRFEQVEVIEVRPEPEIHAPIEVIRGDVLVRMPAQVNTAVLRQIIEAVRGC